MAETKKNNVKVPSKFKKTGKSFLPKLVEANEPSFKPFPQDLKFSGKEDKEVVVLTIRTHWIFLVPKIILGLLIPLLVLVVSVLAPQAFGSISFFFGMFLVSILIGISIIVTAVIHWYYNVNIITDQRVLDLDFHNIVSHTMSEAQLEKIEDISHDVLGIVSSIFDIGTVYIQTASATAEIEFQNIPRPSDVQDILSDLLELKQKGKI